MSTPSFFGTTRSRFTYVSLVTIPGAIVLLGLLMVWLQKSGQGRTIRAVIDNPETSRIVGLKVERTKLLVLALGSALAASAATILLVSRGADSQADNFMVITIAAALIGGIGSMAGVLAGAFIVGIVSNVALMWLPERVRPSHDLRRAPPLHRRPAAGPSWPPDGPASIGSQHVAYVIALGHLALDLRLDGGSYDLIYGHGGLFSAASIALYGTGAYVGAYVFARSATSSWWEPCAGSPGRTPLDG